jgi:hypothetical protein
LAVTDALAFRLNASRLKSPTATAVPDPNVDLARQLERGVAISAHYGDRSCRTARRGVAGDLVTKYDIQIAVAVEIDNRNRRGIEACRIGEIHRRIESAVTAAGQQREADLWIVDGDHQVDGSIAVEITSRQRLAPAGHGVLHSRLERAVAVSQQTTAVFVPRPARSTGPSPFRSIAM